MFATTAEELIRAFRLEVDDIIEDADSTDDADQLWKNEEILNYMTESFDAVARALNNWTTTLSVTVVANTATVALPVHLLHVYYARLITAQVDLREENTDVGAYYQLDDYGNPGSSGGLFSTGTGVPRYYVREYDAVAAPGVSMLRLIPTPAANDTLTMQVSRTLHETLDLNSSLPFNAAPELRLVLLYMKSLAYRKHDAETENLVRANAARAEYDRMVVLREVELRSHRRRPGLIRMEY